MEAGKGHTHTQTQHTCGPRHLLFHLAHLAAIFFGHGAQMLKCNTQTTNCIGSMTIDNDIELIVHYSQVLDSNWNARVSRCL